MKFRNKTQPLGDGMKVVHLRHSLGCRVTKTKIAVATFSDAPYSSIAAFRLLTALKIAGSNFGLRS